MLIIKNILAPIDFSDGSKEALRYAESLAQPFGAAVHLIHVVPGVLPVDLTHLAIMMENDRRVKEAEEILAQWLETLPLEHRGRVLVPTGNAGQEIISAAKSLPADLIIFASHGYTGLKKVLAGGVTERILRSARCPVLVLRAPEVE